MRKPIITILALLFLGGLVFTVAKIVTAADGPCVPKEPAPKSVPLEVG
jgi:hypothetical protein